MAHILCIDDEATALELRRTILERAGHRVDVHTSALKAVELIVSQDYDAVITDWWLEGKTAQGLIQAVKAKGNTPVVVISGFIAEAFETANPAADLYLDKPVDPAELMEILDVLLREHEKQKRV